MKATLYRITISVEALSKDSAPALFREAIEQMGDNESPNGTILKDDGDVVDWSTKTREVEF
jgi:hypothetical protein